MTDKKATLTINDSEAPIELGVLTPTLGPDVLDVRALGSKGYFTFDPGFTSTASCESKITFIDGDKGVLLHRGFLSSSWRKNLPTWKCATSCCTARPQRRKSSRPSRPPSPATP